MTPRNECPFSQLIDNTGLALELTKELEQAMGGLRTFHRPYSREKPEELPRTVGESPDNKYSQGAS